MAQIVSLRHFHFRKFSDLNIMLCLILLSSGCVEPPAAQYVGNKDMGMDAARDMKPVLKDMSVQDMDPADQAVPIEEMDSAPDIADMELPDLMEREDQGDLGDQGDMPTDQGDADMSLCAVECSSNTVCNPSTGDCQPCYLDVQNGNASVGCDDVTPYCREETCVELCLYQEGTTSTECPADRPYCGLDKTCAECQWDLTQTVSVGCAPSEVCANGTCKPSCEQAEDVGAMGNAVGCPVERPYCVGTGCVSCIDNGISGDTDPGCTENLPVCLNSTCVKCRDTGGGTDEHCSLYRPSCEGGMECCTLIGNDCR